MMQLQNGRLQNGRLQMLLVLDSLEQVKECNIRKIYWVSQVAISKILTYSIFTNFIPFLFFIFAISASTNYSLSVVINFL